ncbi:hypothetical protein LJK88_04490 [Paenibacillus sp. P26]|nr:hypothetical protein LJK88_04490 [Paenibacillus sp. P26]UUZ90668.1 hypothetical protein LJK87_33020 [Paenibacillus sp. P25]
MTQQPFPDWLKSALDGRFNELARIAGLAEESEELRRKHAEIEARLKQELTPSIYQLFLEIEDVLNFRSALEKERLYLFGIRDGMRLYKHLQDFIKNDTPIEL